MLDESTFMQKLKSMREQYYSQQSEINSLTQDNPPVKVKTEKRKRGAMRQENYLPRVLDTIATDWKKYLAMDAEKFAK